MNILTIDWDFFIKASRETRDNIYPKVLSGEVPKYYNNYPYTKDLWDNVDLSTTEFYTEDFNKVRNSFYSQQCNFDGHFGTAACISENHGALYAMLFDFLKVKPEDIESITNMDYHHDLYVGTSNKPCCDNWGRLLLDKNPNIQFNWVKRPDSETTTFGEPVPARIIELETVIENIRNNKYDIVHLCRSDPYTPPEYDDLFLELWSVMCPTFFTHVVYDPYVKYERGE